MKPTEKLDTVLAYFAAKETPRAHFDEITNKLSDKIPLIELNPILNKLIKDLYLETYIDQPEQTERLFNEGTMPNDDEVEYYLLTFEGKLFFELGGYKAEEKRKQAKINKENIYTYCVAIGTGIAGLYALCQIAKWIFEFMFYY